MPRSRSRIVATALECANTNSTLVLGRLRDLLHNEANKLRDKPKGALYWITDRDAFSQKWPELIASAALGYFDDNARRAITRLNLLLTSAGISPLSLDIDKLDPEALTKIFHEAAKALHPDVTGHLDDDEQMERESKFKELGELVSVLRELLLKASNGEQD